MSKPKIGVSNICTAFDDHTVGTKVTGRGTFLHVLASIIEAIGGPRNSGFVELPGDSVEECVRCGVAEVSNLSKEDVHSVFYRGKWESFADPRKAAKFDNVSALIYSCDSYCKDPQVSNDEKAALIEEGIDYVLVAVHAGAGDLGSIRLVRNLAGGNRNYIPSGDIEEEVKLLHKVIAEAAKAEAFEDTWLVVADRD